MFVSYLKKYEIQYSADKLEAIRYRGKNSCFIDPTLDVIFTNDLKKTTLNKRVNIVGWNKMYTRPMTTFPSSGQRKHQFCRNGLNSARKILHIFQILMDKCLAGMSSQFGNVGMECYRRNKMY